ncbi:MAG: 50S ribosomal protein L17 [Candidatus Marinimicrobia bacterium]|nr:50S ribosomal protein L17 [Candidatus Neomarinimicrobiota bacterium]
MQHQKRVPKLGRKSSHRKALLSNLAIQLVKHGRIQTTHAKAKALRSVIERLITYGKKGTVHHRRLAFRVLRDRKLVKLLFDHIAPQYMNRQGGYTRILKLGFRDNDAAEISLIEFVDYKKPDEKKSKEKIKEKKTKTKEKVES